MSPHRVLRKAVPARLDVVHAVLLTTAIIVITAGIARWHPGRQHLDLLGYAWLAAGGLPLLWRRRWPLAVFVVSSVAVLSYYHSHYPGGPSLLAPTLALATLTFLRGPVRAAIAGGALVVAVVTSVLTTGDVNGTFDPRLFGFTLWVAVTVAVATIGRMRRSNLAAARDRWAEEERRRAEEARLAIAREVHDVVAHSLAMINVQAGVAAHVADRRPEQAKEALLAIKEASRSALTDLRATLGVLRSGGSLAPTPGLDRLADLMAAASAAGLTVHVEGAPGVLPAPVDVAAYRILQEALTNVVRHAADADTVTVGLRRAADELEITVLDNGSTNGTVPAGGSGLRGMAERAHALGGEADAGPVPAGGFRVRARLPLTGGTDE